MNSLHRSYHSLSLFLVQVTFAFLCRQQKDKMYIFKYFTKLRSYCSHSSSLEGTGCYYSSISLNRFPLEITNSPVSSLSLAFFFLFFVGVGGSQQLERHQSSPVKAVAAGLRL